MALVTTLWGQKLSSNSDVHRDAVREALPPLPSLARALPCAQVMVMRCPPTASETQARMAEVTSGKAVPSLPWAFTSETHPTGHPAFHATETFRASVPNKTGWRKFCFYKRELELRSPSFPQAGDRTGAQPGDTGPHQEVGSPHSGSCFSKCPRHWFKTENLIWGDNDT